LSKVASTSAFVGFLLEAAKRRPVLAGFDFPIGVPAAYGQKTGLADFTELLAAIGEGAWSRFYDVARQPEEISIERPFYPAGSAAGVKQADLLNALGANSLDALRRDCERATPSRRAACPLFWTLGGNQVGKAALDGWVEVLRPALMAGAKLWPFAGELSSLLTNGAGLILAETYPAEAYGHVGVSFAATESKRRQGDRLTKIAAIQDWADQHGITLTPAVAAEVERGFGSDATGEDRFDALMGLFGMIEVASGRRPASGDLGRHSTQWEGWIFGQSCDATPQPSSAERPRMRVRIDQVDQGLIRAVQRAGPETQSAILAYLLAKDESG
jgi:hypothetical protein